MKKLQEYRWIGVTLILCLTLVIFSALNSVNYNSRAAGKAGNFEELKVALESEENEEICLEKDIVIDQEIQVRGKKKIDGNGHMIKRMAGEKISYGGTLFFVKDAELLIQNTKMYGGGTSDVIQKNIYGRLIEIQSGEVVLYSGTVLCANQNVSQNNDGGGAVLVKKNGVLIMEGGTIKGNQNVTKGAGVCVEKGGKFVMNSGEILENKTVGIGPVQGFDGRGGGIYSQGIVEIAGGTIRNNSAKGFVEGSVRYGGVGDAIYAGGKSKLLITGGTISGDVYQVGGTKKKKSQKTSSPAPTTKPKVSAKKKSKNKTTPESLTTATPKSTHESATATPVSAGKRRRPSLRTVPRWFFQREIKDYSQEQWKAELLQECKLDCGDYTIQESSLEWKWNGLLSNQTGKYVVEVFWGHLLSQSITVHITDDSIEENVEEEKNRLLYFCEPEETDKVEEVWNFTVEDLRKIKEYMRGRKDPFSSETNQNFWTLFQGCRGEVEEYVGERK